METGIVVVFIECKGYGFIKPDGGGADVFAHVSDIHQAVPLEEGQHVRYQLGPDKRGRLKATHIVPAEEGN